VLRVIEQAYLSDVGRQRSANEDSLFVRSPLFAVADGMGGAQAGEVASKIAAESFEPATFDGSVAPEAFLRGVIEGANRKIHDISQTDSSRSGMGTTLTAALLVGDELSIGHVGDSRAYLYRDDELRLLTSDHSLVEELRRQGRLTDAQAEDHPQRSIITRALGPESEVQVDTMTYKARAGDVYILCSDGLTTMVKEPAIAAIAGSSAGLDELASELIRTANEAGGRDNITVVAFKVAESSEPAEGEDGVTLIGPSAEEAGLTAGAVREGLSRERSGERRPVSGERSREHAPVAAKPGRGRRLVKSLVALVVLAAVIAAGVVGARHIFFLGTDDGGRLTLYRGLPYDLPLGLELYSKQYSLPIQAASVPQTRRDSVTDHELRSRDDAVSLLDDLQHAAEQVTAKEAASNTNSVSAKNTNVPPASSASRPGADGSADGSGSGGTGSGNTGSSGTTSTSTGTGGSGGGKKGSGGTKNGSGGTAKP
jgi:serine/threonine protein phosphatase PrpC